MERVVEPVLAGEVSDRQAGPRALRNFGEGEYDKTEQAHPARLPSQPGAELPVASRLVDPTPTELMTPETYLGFQRLERYAGSRISPGVEKSTASPLHSAGHELAYGGRWRVDAERVVSGKEARLRSHFAAKNVYLVLGGTGRVQVLLNGKAIRTVRVSGLSRLYTLLQGSKTRRGHPRAPLHPGHLRLRLHLRVALLGLSFFLLALPLFLVLLQVARELGGERVAGRNVQLASSSSSARRSSSSTYAAVSASAATAR